MSATQPGTDAGRALGTTVEQELGLQFKSRDAYIGWLATADALARAIEAEAAAAERERWRRAVMESGGDQALARVEDEMRQQEALDAILDAAPGGEVEG